MVPFFLYRVCIFDGDEATRLYDDPPTVMTFRLARDPRSIAYLFFSVISSRDQ